MSESTVENEECCEFERSGSSPRWRSLSVDASLVRAFGCFDYLVGSNAFRTRNCSVGSSKNVIVLRAHQNPAIILILVQGLHELLWCLSDLLCRLYRSFCIGCIMDREHPGLPNVLHWYIHRPSYRCRLLSSGLQ